jgi:putative transposase
MNMPKCQPEGYIDFLIASQRAVSDTEAAFTRLLHRLDLDPAAPWSEAAPLVDQCGGVPLLDDSTLDKPYARAMVRQAPPRGQRDQPPHLLWADGEALLSCDYQLYATDADGPTKDDHFRAMLAAETRGFAPACRTSRRVVRTAGAG